MKKLLTRSLAFGLVFFGGLTSASANQDGCSETTLVGSYTIFVVGTDKDGKPLARAGMEYYDGKGGIILTGTRATGEAVNRTGSYHVDSRCKAQATYSDKTSYTYFVAPSGDFFDWVATSGDIIAGRETRVSKDNLVELK